MICEKCAKNGKELDCEECKALLDKEIDAELSKWVSTDLNLPPPTNFHELEMQYMTDMLLSAFNLTKKDLEQDPTKPPCGHEQCDVEWCHRAYSGE